MVSLEEKNAYLLGIQSNPKLRAFHELLSKKAVFIPDEKLSEIDEIYFCILHSVSKNDKNEFDKVYLKISRRKIDSDSPSPFIHDDVLIFVLILGILKYNYTTEWIHQVINARIKNETTTTFKSLLNHDYFNKSNLHQMVISFLQMYKDEALPENYIDDAYRAIAFNISLFQNRSDFQIILALSTYDWIILSKDTGDGAFEKLKRFEAKFLKRVRLLSIVIFNVFLLLIVYGIFELLSISPKIADTFNLVATIVGFLGVAILGNFFTYFRDLVENFIKSLLGYKK